MVHRHGLVNTIWEPFLIPVAGLMFDLVREYVLVGLMLMSLVLMLLVLMLMLMLMLLLLAFRDRPRVASRRSVSRMWRRQETWL